MYLPYEFRNFDDDFTKAAIDDLFNAKLPLQVEEACYNLAGQISSDIANDFDLTKIYKRDVALYICTQKGGIHPNIERNLSKIAKYIRTYFAVELKPHLDENTKKF